MAIKIERWGPEKRLADDICQSGGRQDLQLCRKGQIVGLKNFAELCERIKLDEVLTFGRCGDLRVFQNPRVFVEEKHCMQPGCERRVDIAFGAVADHPGGLRANVLAKDDFTVSRRIFFSDNLN